MSRCLTDRGVDHVVIERGRLGERWRTARWDSFRLLTPAWMTRLPGHAYRGDDDDAYLTAAELVAYLGDYARSFDAPVHEMTTVIRGEPARRRVHRADRPWRVAVLQCGHRDRLPQPRPGPGRRPPVLPRDRRAGQPGELPPAGSPARRRCPRGRRLGVRGSDRRRADPVRARRGARGRLAHPPAPQLPRPRHPLVARPDRFAGPDHRRPRRPGRRAPRAVTATGRHAAPGGPRRAAGPWESAWPAASSRPTQARSASPTTSP